MSSDPLGENLRPQLSKIAVWMVSRGPDENDAAARLCRKHITTDRTSQSDLRV